MSAYMQIRNLNEKEMIKKDPTPAQAYAKRCIYALQELINNPEDNEWQDEVHLLLMERPQTLKCALSAYLYKSEMARLSRR